jgi:transglutaminase-like putative cysteine protease/lipoprotein NlpI
MPEAMATDALSMRLSDVQYFVGDASQAYVHRALMAHEAAGIGALGQIEIEFQPDYQKVHLHTLRIIRGGKAIDKLKTADIRFLQRERGLDNGVYSGTATAAIVNPDVRLGDTLEVEYTIVGDNPVFGGKFFQAAAWDSSAPTSLRRVILNTPENRPIAHQLAGGSRGSDPVVSETQAIGRRIVSFTAERLPATLHESAVPGDVQAYRWLQFSEFDSWRAVNRWAQGLFDSKPSAALAEAVAPMRNAASQEAAVTQTLAFVQNEIRYLSISMGQNSHRPFAPDIVLARRYGDCKDKSLLMVAMLRELGIAAEPVLVSTTMRKGLKALLPSPALFDHAIVRVTLRDQEYYLDPTRQGQYGPLDRMGQTHAGNEVLPVAASTAGLAEVGQAAAATTQFQRSERVVVQSMAEPVEMTVVAELAGAEAEAGRVQLEGMSKQQLYKYYDGALVKRYPASELLDPPKVVDDREQNRLVITTRYRVSNMFTETAEGWRMSYTPVSMAGMVPMPDGARRQFPLQLGEFPAQSLYSLEIAMPETYHGVAGVSEARIDSPAFTAARKIDVGGRKLLARLSLSLNADRVAPAAIAAYLADAQKFDEFTNGGFRVFKEEFGAAKSLQTVAQKLEASLEASNRMVKDAELTGRDASDALCERALVRAYLGQHEAALADAVRATQLQPLSAELLRCRADVHLMAGRFKESESDFTKAIARGADTFSAYLGRGIGALQLGRTGVASADFGSAAGKAASAEQRLRAAVWDSISKAQQDGLGSVAPAAPLSAAAEAEPGAAWLQAARQLYAGSGTADQLVFQASRNAGIEAESRLAEAYFYIGKYYLLKGDKLRARVYFERVREKKILNSLYDSMARWELGRTGQSAQAKSTER